MKRLFLAIIALAAFVPTPAPAADLPPNLPSPNQPTYVPFFSWNGFYMGINAGYGFGQSSWTSASAATGSFSANGPTFGGQFGFNVQKSAWVFGLEGDYNWANLRGSTVTNCPASCETRLGWLSTVRGRIGYAFDRFLPYVTAGGAFGNVKASTPTATGAAKNQIGFAAGGGLEYAFVKSWTAKVEYLYVDLGKFDCGSACGVSPPNDIKFKTHLVRAGVNVKF